MMSTGTNKKIENPNENPNLMPERNLGAEPGAAEFEDTENSLRSNPVKLPAREPTQEEILREHQPTDPAGEQYPGLSRTPTEELEVEKNREKLEKNTG